MTDFEKKWIERHPEAAGAAPRQTAEEKEAAKVKIQPVVAQATTEGGALRVTRTYQPAAISQQSETVQSDFEKKWIERHPESAGAAPRQTAEEREAAKVKIQPAVAQATTEESALRVTRTYQPAAISQQSQGEQSAFEKSWLGRHPDSAGAAPRQTAEEREAAAEQSPRWVDGIEFADLEKRFFARHPELYGDSLDKENWQAHGLFLSDAQQYTAEQVRRQNVIDSEHVYHEDAYSQWNND